MTKFLTRRKLKDYSPIILLIVLAGFLRIFHLDWGLPQPYRHDGVNYVEMALRFGTGEFEPYSLCHGTFLPFLLFAEFGIFYLYGKIAGTFHSINEFVLSYLNDPTPFFLIGRWTVALFGIGSIVLTYMVGNKLFNRRIAIIAALIISLSPTHFMFSTTIKADIPATFFVALSAYLLSVFLMQDHNEKNMWAYRLAGFFLGFALATKLTSLPGIFLLPITYLIATKPLSGRQKFLPCLNSIKECLIGLGFILIGFVIAEPYTLLNFKKFIASVLYLREEYIESVSMKYPELFHITNHIPNLIGWPLLFVFLLTIIYIFFRPTNQKIFILIFPLTYYLISCNSVGFAYFYLPSLSFIALISGVGIDNLVSYFKSKRFQNLILAVSLSLLLSAPGLNCIRCFYLLSRPDTRTLAKEWIEKNIPANKSLLVEGAVANFLILGPPLRGNLDTLKDDLTWVMSHGGSGRLQRMMISNYNPKERSYRIYKTAQVLRAEDVGKFKPDYVITSGFFDDDLGELEYRRGKDYYHDRRRLYNVLEENYQMIKIFKPFPRLKFYYPTFLSADYKNLQKISLFDQKEVTAGPEIKIFQKNT